MTFDQLVIEKIEPILRRWGYKIVERYENFFRFQSGNVEMRIAYNFLDKGHYFEIGKKNAHLHPINDSSIKQVFGVDIKVEQVSKEVFADNIVVFLETKGSDILKGNLDKLTQLETFVVQKSEKYTSGLIEKQCLESANKAWDSGNYREFIRLLEHIHVDNIPKSYLLKYKIASQRI